MTIEDESELQTIQDYAFRETDLDLGEISLPVNVKKFKNSFDDLMYNYN